MVKIVHIISALNVGGAETTLLKVLSRLNARLFESKVISLTTDGPIGVGIRSLGIPIFALGMRRGIPNPLALLRLAQWLRKNRCDVVQTWMYHADLIGGLAAKLAGNIPVIWNIRHGNPETSRRMTRCTVKACAATSRWLPERIVCCSKAAGETHRTNGYADCKITIIPNGFDLSVFRPDREARRSVRQELGIPEEAPVIGLIARFHPEKDHRNFITAAGMISSRYPDVRFLLCGSNVTWKNQQLLTWIDDAAIRERCYLLGQRDDIWRVHAALDIAMNASRGEGFPNVIAEAMACGVPCVVTDVGESAYIVDGTGRVVPPGDPAALAASCGNLLEILPEERIRLGLAARRRVEEHFGLAGIVARYEALYQRFGEHPPAPRNVA